MPRLNARQTQGTLAPCVCSAFSPGCIRPEGWLKTQISALADGVTGRLEQLSDYLKWENNGWINPDASGGWEEFPLWLRSYYPLAATLDDAEMLKKASCYVDLILQTKQPDGWFGPKQLKHRKGKDGRTVTDLWGHILLLYVFRWHYEITRDERILSVFHDLIVFALHLPDGELFPQDRIGNFGWGGGSFGSMQPFVQQFRAGDALAPLYWYYEVTGDQAALDMAVQCYLASDFAWDEWLDHHAVNFAQRISYATVFSRQSGETWQRESAQYWWLQHSSTWGQAPRGLLHMDERLRPSCVDPRQAFETCAMAELTKSMCEIGNILGQTWTADLIEDIMLNNYPVAYTPDYRALHYLTGANMPMLDDYPFHPTRNGSRSQDHKRSYLAYTPFNRCCGHTAGIAWPLYTMNAVKRMNDGIAVWLYGPWRLNTGNWQISSDTVYPFEEEIRLKIQHAPQGEQAIYLRIPKWAESTVLRLNGETIYTTKEKCGFLKVAGTWNTGDELRVQFEMKLSLTRWPRNGAATVDHGPLSYSVSIREKWVQHKGITGYPESEDWPSWEVIPMSKWNYALDKDVLSDAQLIRRQVASQPFTREDAPVIIRMRVREITQWNLSDHVPAPLQHSPVRTEAPAEWIDFIPMGCARLRMSVLPVVGNELWAHTWKPAPAETALSSRPKNRFDDINPAQDRSFIDL